MYKVRTADYGNEGRGEEEVASDLGFFDDFSSSKTRSISTRSSGLVVTRSSRSCRPDFSTVDFCPRKLEKSSEIARSREGFSSLNYPSNR